VLYVIFHKRVRVFYRGFQTCENNRIHESVHQAISLFSWSCKTLRTIKTTRPFRPRVFIVFRVLQILENNKNRLVNSLVNSIFSRVFGNPGKTLALVYEIFIIYRPGARGIRLNISRSDDIFRLALRRGKYHHWVYRKLKKSRSSE
jgi:hypothetical protein